MELCNAIDLQQNRKFTSVTADSIFLSKVADWREIDAVIELCNFTDCRDEAF